MRRNRWVRTGLLALALLVLLSAAAQAKVVSPGRDFYYLDGANVLSEALEGEIFFSNKLLDSACGAQAVVVTVETTGSEAIGDYAYELFNKWGIGDSKRDNGFLLLLAIGDEDYYALCGTGLQDRFTAGTLKSYYDQYLEDDFAAGNYESGVKRFFEAAFERIAETYSANVTIPQGVAAYERYIAANGAQTAGFGGHSNGSNGRGSDLLRTIVIIAVALLALRFLFRRRRRPHASGSGLMKLFLLSRLFRRRRPTGGNVWQHAHTYRPRSTGNSGWLSGGSHGSSGSRPSGASRGSGFGGARGGGGRTSGGGAGRGRH